MAPKLGDILSMIRAVVGLLNGFSEHLDAMRAVPLAVLWKDEEYYPYCNPDLTLAVHGPPIITSTRRDRSLCADLVKS